MNGSECKMKACVNPMLISTVLIAIFLAGSEMLIHGYWLMPLYEQTPNLWRPKAEMGQFPWCMIRLLTLAFLYSALYCKCSKAKESCAAPVVDGGKKECPMKHSLCFGLVLGALIGTMMASSYLWMPVSGELAIKWFIGGLVQGVCVGIMLGFIAKAKMCKKA